MKKKVISSIIKLLPRSVVAQIESPLRYKLRNSYRSFSQNGEDVLIQRITNYKKNGFYIDVGAHHPIRFSNTYNFYLQGWRGINVDAMPGSMKAFDQLRPGDKNIEVGVSLSEGILNYYVFNEPALNTFSKEEADRKTKNPAYKVIQVIPVTTLPLSKLLDLHLPMDTVVDYLNIDVEGFDLQVLESNNWDKCRPTIISVECNISGAVQNSGVYSFLTERGYQLSSVLLNTLIFTKHGSGANSVIRI